MTILLLIMSAGIAVAAPQTYPPMTQYGQEYANTCNPSEKKELRASLVKMQLPKQEQAWRLIDTLLCAEKTPAHKRLIRNTMAKKIKAQYDGTGQDTHFETIKPSDDSAERLMAGGSAWDATFERVRSGGWEVRYSSDEVSMTSFTIDYKKGKWLITKHASASD